jgi:hypothetical protein
MYAIANTEYLYFISHVKNPEYLAFVLRSQSGYLLPIPFENNRVFPVFIVKTVALGARIYLLFLRSGASCC